MGVNLLTPVSTWGGFPTTLVSSTFSASGDYSATWDGESDDDYLRYADDSLALNGKDLAFGFTSFSCPDNLPYVVIQVRYGSDHEDFEFLATNGLSRYTFKIKENSTGLRIYLRHEWESAGYTRQAFTLTNVYLEETTNHLDSVFPPLASWSREGDIENTLVFQNQNSATWSTTSESSYLSCNIPSPTALYGKTLKLSYDSFTSGDNLSWFTVRVYADSTNYITYETKNTATDKFLYITIPDNCYRISVYLRHQYDADGFSLTQLSVSNFRAEELIGFNNTIKMHAKGAWGYGASIAAAAVPAGYAEGDLLVLMMTGRTSMPDAPTGWTTIAAELYTSEIHFRVCYKYAVSSESAVTIGNSNGYVTAIMFLFKGVASSNPINAYSTGISDGRDFVVPSLITTIDQAFIVYAIGFYQSYSAYDNKNLEDPADPELVGFQKYQDEFIGDSSSSNGGIAMAGGTQVTKGLVPSMTAAGDTSSDRSAVIVFALAPQVTVSPCVITVSPDKEKINGSGLVAVSVTTDIPASAFEARATLLNASYGRGIGINLISDDLDVDAAGVHTFSTPTSSWSFDVAYSEIANDGAYRISVYARNANGVWSG